MIGRERCNHNLRIRIPGKSSICLICHCNKLEDSLGFKHSAAMIGDIIHQIRLMNSVLDAVDEKNAETQLTPVLRTCKGNWPKALTLTLSYHFFLKLVFIFTSLANEEKS